MKKLLLAFLFMVGGSTVEADDYPYLTFQTTDGAKTSVSVASLSLIINGTTLTAGLQSFTLADLSKMYFSTTDETTTFTKTACALTFSSTTATATMDEGFTAPTLTNPYNLSLTWTSSDENVASVDETGTVTLVADGATVITAAFAGDENFEAGSASYTLTVTKATAVTSLSTVQGKACIYSLAGVHLADYATLSQARESLRSGIYVVVINGKRYKISIR